LRSLDELRLSLVLWIRRPGARPGAARGGRPGPGSDQGKLTSPPLDRADPRVGVQEVGRGVALHQGRIAGQVFDLLTGIAKLRVAGAEAHAFARWGPSSQNGKVPAPSWQRLGQRSATSRGHAEGGSALLQAVQAGAVQSHELCWRQDGDSAPCLGREVAHAFGPSGGPREARQLARVSPASARTWTSRWSRAPRASAATSRS